MGVEHFLFVVRPMRRRAVAGTVLAVLATGRSVVAQEAVPPPVLNDEALFKKSVLSTLGPSGMLHATLASALDQLRQSPDEWNADAPGYAKRWLSEFAESAIG